MALRMRRNLLWKLIGAVGAGIGAPLLLALVMGSVLNRPLLALLIGSSIGILVGTWLVVRITSRQLQALSSGGSSHEYSVAATTERRIERSVEETVDRS